MRQLHVIAPPSLDKTRWFGYLSKLYSEKHPVVILTKQPQSFPVRDQEEWMKQVSLKVLPQQTSLYEEVNSQGTNNQPEVTGESVYLLDSYKELFPLGEHPTVLFTTGDKQQVESLEKYLKWLISQQVATEDKKTIHLVLYGLMQDSKLSEIYFEKRIKSLFEGTAYQLVCHMYPFDEMDQTRIQENEYENRYYFKSFSKSYKSLMAQMLEVLGVKDAKERSAWMKLAERSKK